MTATTAAPSSACLTEDELLGLAAGSLADAPAAEAHLARCATCSALLAGAVRAGAARAWDSLAGSTLGPYRLDAQIGAGGMGAVYRAWDPRLDRAIAVKVLHAGDAARAARLAVEARAAAAIDHRAIVGIYDVGVDGGIPYVAMELVEGESLRSAVARGGLGIPRVRELAIELADGLAAAHARGVVHRDLKPENLVLARGGLRILDFGLARLGEGSSLESTPLDATEPGAVRGTPGYMAPEQARGEPVDARADLFAAGAIAYELATGRRAFPGATHADRLSATLRDEPPLDGLGELAPIVARCLAKEPRDRFQSAADLAWALRATAPGPAVAPAPSDAPAPPPAPARRMSRRALLTSGAGALATGALGYALGRCSGRASAPFDDPERSGLRLLTHRTGRVYSARFTHDGGRVVYGAAWDTDPVQPHLLDLASGETFALDLPSADVLSVSRRGELAASVGHRFVDHQSARGRLVVVPLAGGVPRPLAEDAQDADFAGSGSLAVVRAGAQGFRIELPLGTPLVEDPGWITHVRVSPDGARVAYVRHPHTNDDGGDLMIADVATRTTRALASGWVSLAGLAWDPAGDAVWFTGSRRDLVNALHRATLDGTVTAQPVQATGRLRLHDVAADRRALVTIDTWRLRAIAGDRDRSLSEVSYVSDISADGTQVVVGELGRLEAGTGAYLVPYAGGRPLRLGRGFPIAISPSGQRVAVNLSDGDRLVVYSTGSGETASIAAPGFVTAGRWLDERSLVVLFSDRLWRVSLDGPPAALAGPAHSLALDPARRRCAYLDRAGSLLILDLATRESRSLPGSFAHAALCGWLAEPDAIVIRSTTTPLVLERIDASTGARTHHLDVQPPRIGLKAVDTLALHPDGVRLAYSYGQELSQLYLLAL